MICSSPKPSQTWPICWRYSSRSCGSMSHDHEPAARLQHARRFAPARAAGSGTWCSTSISVAASSSASAIGSASSSPRRTSTFAHVAQPAARRLQHLRRCDRRRSTRATNGASAARDLPGAAAEIADDPALDRAAPGSACRWTTRGRTAPRAAGPTARPPTRRTPATCVCRRASTPFRRRASWSAPAVGADLLAQQRPQPPRRRVALVERQRVVAARAVAARRDPAGVRQRLQVPADGGLRQLQHGAELRHRQLVPLEQQQHPAAGRIRERASGRRRCAGISIRISGWIVT